jgi:hypothetical protein
VPSFSELEHGAKISRYGFAVKRLEGPVESALASLLLVRPIRAIFMGQRRDDPGATTHEAIFLRNITLSLAPRTLGRPTQLFLAI